MRHHADPARASLLLPHRLATALGCDLVRPGERLMRGLRPATRTGGLSRRRRPLVGRRCRPVARWVGQADPHSVGCRHPWAGTPNPCGPGRRPPKPRHLEQRRRQSRGLLPAMPHDPRSAGASEATLAHYVPAQSARRLVWRSLRLIGRHRAPAVSQFGRCRTRPASRIRPGEWDLCGSRLVVRSELSQGPVVHQPELLGQQRAGAADPALGRADFAAHHLGRRLVGQTLRTHQQQRLPL